MNFFNKKLTNTRIFLSYLKKQAAKSSGRVSYVNRVFQSYSSGHSVMSIGNFPPVKQSFAARRTIV